MTKNGLHPLFCETTETLLPSLVASHLCLYVSVFIILHAANSKRDIRTLYKESENYNGYQCLRDMQADLMYYEFDHAIKFMTLLRLVCAW